MYLLDKEVSQLHEGFKSLRNTIYRRWEDQHGPASCLSTWLNYISRGPRPRPGQLLSIILVRIGVDDLLLIIIWIVEILGETDL